jgi:hypothetical protein
MHGKWLMTDETMMRSAKLARGERKSPRVLDPLPEKSMMDAFMTNVYPHFSTAC